MAMLNKAKITLRAANAPLFNSNKVSVESLLHIFSIQVCGRFIPHADIYSWFFLLKTKQTSHKNHPMNTNKNVRSRKAIHYQLIQNLALLQNRRQANIEGDIIGVYELADLR